MKRLTVVESSMVHAVGYDRASRILEVIFNDGKIYFYGDVPRGVYVGLLAADSIGHYMQENVIPMYATWRLGRAPKTSKRPAATAKGAKRAAKPTTNARKK